MKLKRFIAVAMVATMVFGNCVTAFADDAGVTGAGVVEYDDSTAVVYDSVTVPTLTASKYDFAIDPTGLLHEYDADQYAAGSVYFSSVSTYESLIPNATKLGTDEKLYEAKKAVYAKDGTSNKWKGIVKTATKSDAGVITVSALEENFFVWTPAGTVDTHYTNGSNGEWTELDATNYSKWLVVSGNDTDGYELDLRNDYKSGDDICDGKIYTITYSEIAAAGIVEAVGSEVDVEEYATITDGAVSAYKNVYTRSGEGTEASPYTYAILAANSDKMDYTPAKTTKNGNTDTVDITNKATRAKQVKAVITMKNAEGLKFKATNAYGDNEADTSVYFAATDGTTPVAFVASEDGKTATATYDVTIAAKGGDADVTYQTDETNAAGGHKYARYEGAFPTFTTKAFYITASANTKAEAKTAWTTWAKGITADTRPSINIVYTVKPVYTEEEQAAMDAEAAETAAAAFQTKYATILAKDADSVTYDDLAAENGITAALEEFATLDSAVQTLLAEDKATLDALKTAAEAKAITDETATLQYINSVKAWYVGDTTSAGLSDATFTISSITMKKDNGEAVDVSSIAEVVAFNNSYWIAVDYEAGADLGITYSAGSTYTVVAVVGNTRYTASKTY